MEIQLKKSAVDLTDLAVGIIILGIVVSIGANILITFRDSRLTDLPTFLTTNETIGSPVGGKVLSNPWFKEINSVINSTGTGQTISAANYSVTVDPVSGLATIINATPVTTQTWNVSYVSYNTSNPDWAVANDAAIGLGEYGNWFNIIVIVGVAAIVLALIFMAFGNRSQGSSGSAY